MYVQLGLFSKLRGPVIIVLKRQKTKNDQLTNIQKSQSFFAQGQTNIQKLVF